ncbi:hypothetical protein D9611_010533 [Ephemerocybe angulata]|uniref:Uncharacterized protein n=1 Tax=Ephemerocybe angulata TaxID=980116 RepID=A0A8H5BVA8_9AGAR|nr:hypothetical protein D9611_010533 [Tulosesus angulatus]
MQWNFQANDDGTYKIALDGVACVFEENGEVVSSRESDSESNSTWRIDKHFEHGENVYIIVMASEQWKGWTVPDSPADEYASLIIKWQADANRPYWTEGEVFKILSDDGRRRGPMLEQRAWMNWLQVDDDLIALRWSWYNTTRVYLAATSVS